MRKLLLVLIVFSALSGYSQKGDEPFIVFNERDEKTGDAIVYATNNYPCEESVYIEFTALQNMKADVDLPYKGVVPAGAVKHKLFTLSIKDKTKGSQLGVYRSALPWRHLCQTTR